MQAKTPSKPTTSTSLLSGARVYLSGPMDFVASRADEKQFGWRNRVGDLLRHFGVTVFDPWFKPDVRGFHEYGKEDEVSAAARELWTFDDSEAGAKARASCAEQFWATLHIDLRMVDTSDFIVSYCPTNIYSVGTPHEIIMARLERKPVLFVSPAVSFPTLDALRSHLESEKDAEGSALLERLENEVPIKPNPDGVPSLWYMPLVDSEHFFDGFGFGDYRSQFDWPEIPLDAREQAKPPVRPLLPFLERLDRELPKSWDRHRGEYRSDDDWILWDLSANDEGAFLRDIYQARVSGDARPS
jgi:hypothetical protein